MNRNMKLEIKKNNIIKDVDTWFKFAEPKGGEKQWKEGRSAKVFAQYMTSSNGDIPTEIENYLKNIGISDRYFVCYPEEETSFDGYKLGKGAGRNHDGLLVSKGFLVGIEAKVSEPFDLSIKAKMDGAKKNSDKGENMHTRIFNSLKMINPEFCDESLNSVGSLMYQLISGTIGTIIEAKRRSLSKAAFLIIEFDGDVDNKGKANEKNIVLNQNAYNEYLAFLHLSNKEDKDRFILLEDGIKVWISKINIWVKKETYQYYNIGNN